MKHGFGLLIALLALFWVLPPAVADEEALFGLVREGSTADLDAMRKKGVVRVLVSYNRTSFFLSGAQRQGFEYELLKQYEKFLNRKPGPDGVETQMVFVPTPFSELIPALLAGKGDLIAAAMTVTPERAKQVAFTAPYIPDVREIVVSHEGAGPLTALEDLTGRSVFVLRGSSYAQHLAALNEKWVARGLDPMHVVEVDRHLQTEDLLEMVNTGALRLMVADEHIARLWAELLPEIRLHPDLVVNAGGAIAWAVRPGNPQLLASLNRFIESNRKGTLMGNILFKRYYEDTHWIGNPVDQEDRERLGEIAALIQEYAGRYGFDWLAIGAQAYQESGLDQSQVSPAGAVGVMQLLKSTASAPPVEIADIDELENNIHAGVKYLDFIRNRYFDDPEMAPEDRVYFSFAAYNAGPAKIRRVRQRAQQMGLDPNRWFGQTELAALEMIGQETVRYVRNILKYYTVFKLSFRVRPQLQQQVMEAGEGA